MSKILHLKQQKVKFTVRFVAICVIGLPTNNSLLYLHYKSGKHLGKTKKTFATKNGEAQFAEEFQFNTKFISKITKPKTKKKNKKKRKKKNQKEEEEKEKEKQKEEENKKNEIVTYSKKLLVLRLKLSDTRNNRYKPRRKNRTVAMLKINLSQFAFSKDPLLNIYEFKLRTKVKLKTRPSLLIAFHVTPLQLSSRLCPLLQDHKISDQLDLYKQQINFLNSEKISKKNPNNSKFPKNSSGSNGNEENNNSDLSWGDDLTEFNGTSEISGSDSEFTEDEAVIIDFESQKRMTNGNINYPSSSKRKIMNRKHLQKEKKIKNLRTFSSTQRNIGQSIKKEIEKKKKKKNNQQGEKKKQKFKELRSLSIIELESRLEQLNKGLNVLIETKNKLKTKYEKNLKEKERISDLRTKLKNNQKEILEKQQKEIEGNLILESNFESKVLKQLTILEKYIRERLKSKRQILKVLNKQFEKTTNEKEKFKKNLIELEKDNLIIQDEQKRLRQKRNNVSILSIKLKKLKKKKKNQILPDLIDNYYKKYLLKKDEYKKKKLSIQKKNNKLKLQLSKIYESKIEKSLNLKNIEQNVTFLNKRASTYGKLRDISIHNVIYCKELNENLKTTTFSQENIQEFAELIVNPYITFKNALIQDQKRYVFELQNNFIQLNTKKNEIKKEIKERQKKNRIELKEIGLNLQKEHKSVQSKKSILKKNYVKKNEIKYLLFQQLNDKYDELEGEDPRNKKIEQTIILNKKLINEEMDVKNKKRSKLITENFTETNMKQLKKMIKKTQNTIIENNKLKSQFKEIKHDCLILKNAKDNNFNQTKEDIMKNDLYGYQKQLKKNQMLRQQILGIEKPLIISIQQCEFQLKMFQTQKAQLQLEVEWVIEVFKETTGYDYVVGKDGKKEDKGGERREKEGKGKISGSGSGERKKSGGGSVRGREGGGEGEGENDSKSESESESEKETDKNEVEKNPKWDIEPDKLLEIQNIIKNKYSKSNKDKELISERNKGIYKQSFIITELEQKLNINLIIEQEKLLIERIFFFSEPIYSKKYPIPACLIINFFLLTNSFTKGSELVLGSFIDSLKLMLRINRDERKLLIWILINILFSIRLLIDLVQKDPEEFNFKKIDESFTKIRLNYNQNYLQDDDFNNSSSVFNNSHNSNDNGNDNDGDDKTKNDKKESSLNIIKILDNYSKIYEKKLISEMTFIPNDEPIFNLHKELGHLANEAYINIIDTIEDEIKYSIARVFINNKSSTVHSFLSKLDLKVNTILDIFQEIDQLSKTSLSLPFSFSLTVIKHILSFINSTIFHQLLNKKKFCTIGHSLKIKESITKIESWISQNGFEEAINELGQIKNAVDLIIMNKVILKDPLMEFETCTTVLNNLTLFQIYYILSNFTPDEFDAIAIQKEDLKSLWNFAKSKQIENGLDEINIEIETNSNLPITIDFLKIDCEAWQSVNVPKKLQEKIDKIKEFKFAIN
ncbi:hypothetical protein M0812_00079 [Anaeramoeba flamelloides]|uniref:Dilute domain-containing protein n=1 Tax=Anaeramoeba flamelloides TaxID=1746091 RepID=A0AAV8A466_9EUKA|nr:hypothetical protein M0812_00079 [Anaeramoeba flamelloides]